MHRQPPSSTKNGGVPAQLNKTRIMDHPKRSFNRHEALHIDPTSRGESSSSYSVHRSHSSGHEYFAPSPGSSIGASVSMFSSRNSEAEIGDSEETDGMRTIVMNIGVQDMLLDKEILTRYPEFHQFMQIHQPTWFEPAPYNGTVYRVLHTTPPPESAKRLRKDIQFEMLDLMFRFYRQKHVNTQRKREIKELVEANKQLRIAAVQMFTKAEQEEEFISNSLLKKIQQLNQDKDYLVKKYQQDEESLTKSLMANVAKIPDVHADETEKLMADKQAEIDRLRVYCQRAEKNYQEELFRLRAEKVDHEAALEQEQELLINTLGKRMSMMNEDKRKMQKSLEQAYVQGFVEYNETVEAALHASNQSNNAPPLLRGEGPSGSSASVNTRAQMNETASLQIENKRLQGQVNQEKRRAQNTDAEVKKLSQRMSKMEAILESAIRNDGSLALRLAALNFEGTEDKRRSCHGASPPTNVVIGQPNASRAGSSTAAAEHAHAQVAPILATVHPTQRAARPDQQ